ncbi:hypothetical protein VKT23_006241 [Stygiomarasmius scandens]|uniref:Uncharacterized protein n=1 Tax=Marasmiellus scandens TaxID=2682957 RepID=A0ABR1JM94_9AGAR
MVNVLSLATAAAAATVAIVDHTQTFAVDLTNTQCANFAPVEQFTFHRTAAEVWKLNAVAGTQNQFHVQHVRCGNALTWAGSTSGAIAERSQTVALNGSDTVFTITPVNASSSTGPFRFTESVSGAALTAWAVDGTHDGSSAPITLERSRDDDPRQMFFFTTPL